MDLLKILDRFKLYALDDKWSNEIWDKEFLTFPEPPVDYSILLCSEKMENFLKETCRIIKKWITENTIRDEFNNQEKMEISWQTLTALNINVRGLLAILGYLLKIGQATGADEDSRQACLSSASLYFILLGIPGSSTFHIFHPNLYQQAIETLKLSECLMSKQNHKTSDVESLYTDNQIEDLSQSEKITLTKGLNSLLFELITMLKTFYMKYQVRSLEMTVINLIKVTKLETEINHFQTYQHKEKIASKTSLSHNAYVALQNLCDPKHGTEEDTIRLILKYLMPHLCPHYLNLPHKALNVIWDTVIYFIKNLIVLKGVSANLGTEILIQHLLVNCPERSEPRQKQALTVSKLINICQGNMFLKNIENLIKFSFHDRIPYRIFAQEIIGKLLKDITINIPNHEINNRKKAEKLLIAIVFSRSEDSSSMVRGKALSITESIANSGVLNIKDFLNMSEEDKSFPTVTVLLDALKTDIDHFPGSNTFNSMLLDRLKDERALIRRNAMHVLQNLVTHSSTLLDKVAPIIAQHCRDPAVSVRRDAIDTLTTLLETNSNNEKLLTEYIKNVLPRIYDVEIKIQEKVVESLENLVVNKIILFTSERSDQDHDLSWKIINKLTAEKMKKNLSKICDIWVKNGSITNSLISKIQSYITTDHNTEAWILLSAIAENIKLPSMKKYFEDYKKVIKGNDFVTTLKLEVLRYSWQSMEKSYLETVSAHIFDCLCNFQISLENIGICIDILGDIMKLLSSQEENLMHLKVLELIQISETQIEQLPEEEDIDETLMEIYLKAMNTLGHTSFLCNKNVSESILHIIQGLILDCESMRASLNSIEKFKAAGIVILGQQALRDRDVAEQVMPILGRLMCQNNTSESLAQAAIRINAVKVLADLCVKFTALVEPYLSDMCISMKDTNVRVRETIVVIFVQLLLEDYIKVKGLFFYHILTMLSDEDETIRELTIFLIKERLLKKNKNLITQSFVRSIFHYNNCQTKHKFNEKKMRKKERETLTLPGKNNESKRRVIYDFMLEHLDPPNKIKILTKLNSEILEGICEKSINIKENEGASVLKDALYIMSSDQIQASYNNKSQDEDFQDENATVIQNPMANAINIIAEGMKQFKFKIMVQTLIRLRNFLSNSKSPLLKDISTFFIKVLSEFNKDQIAEIYDEHPDLKQDLERDISTCRKVIQTTDSDANNDHEFVHNCVNEENMCDFLNEKDLNFNESIKSTTKRKHLFTTPKRIHDVQLNYIPKIVLRRLSTLTYPGIKEWISPPRETRNFQSSDPGPSSSRISVSSSSLTEDITIPLFNLSEPEISHLPKPKKLARLSKATGFVQNS